MEERVPTRTSLLLPQRLRRWGSSSFVALGLLLGLTACNPVDDRLWPSIRPPAAGRPAPAAPAPYVRPLPATIWEWSGVFSLLLGAGAVGVVYWRFPGLREEFASLRDQTRRLHERRDRSTADLAQMARSLRDLEQEIGVLRRELDRRDRQAFVAAPPNPAPLAPLSPPPLAPPNPAPLAQPDLPHLSPPSPPGRSRLRPIPPPAPPSPPISPPLPEPDVAAPPSPERSLSPAPVSLLTQRLATEAVSEVAPAPALRAAPSPSPSPWEPQTGPGLAALIEAINSRGRAPIEGVTCVELDLAPPPEDGAVEFESLAPRLRMVARGGRFLLVMVEGDAWLFPSIETLDRWIESPIDVNLFAALPASIDRPQLMLPAMLREVGGLWEVTDPGKVLVPAP